MDLVAIAINPTDTWSNAMISWRERKRIVSDSILFDSYQILEDKKRSSDSRISQGEPHDIDVFAFKYRIDFPFSPLFLYKTLFIFIFL